MAIDREVEDAISQVFVSHGQSEAAAKRFSAWLRDMSERELEPSEKLEHLEMLRTKLNTGI